MKFADLGDYMDILIYVIIMVVGLVASAFRNNARRKAAMEEQPRDIIPEFPDIDFRPVFERDAYNEKSIPREEVIYQDLEEEVVPEPFTEISSNIDSEPVLEETANSSIEQLDVPVAEGQSAFEGAFKDLRSDNMNDLGISLTDLQPENNDILKDEISDYQEAEVVETLDLTQAVIYSEILKQKYFTNSY